MAELSDREIATDTYVRAEAVLSADEAAAIYRGHAHEIIAKLGRLPLGERDEAVAEAMRYEAAAQGYSVTQ
ncbi:MAG: hypothetical protein JWN82_264 [Candidatus Saccharibacteria bacterium]|nr:hypothetical protein [Candidatus Saccharibacteria bacterium]